MMPLLDSCKRWRFLILLGMLLLLLVVQPIVFGFSASPVWFDALFLLVTVALLFSFSLERKWRTAAYALPVCTDTRAIPMGKEPTSAGTPRASRKPVQSCG